MGDWILPVLIAALFIWALIRGVNAYQSFVNGVKEGLELFASIYPAMLAMLFMVAVLDQSGLMLRISTFFQQLFPQIPASLWPMAIFRPISGNASLAILHSIFANEGVDSLAGFVGSILQGATDTTFMSSLCILEASASARSAIHCSSGSSRTSPALRLHFCWACIFLRLCEICLTKSAILLKTSFQMKCFCVKYKRKAEMAGGIRGWNDCRK
ncbi:MAG: hypothetical protein ACLVJX_02975 [Merdibacter sp.]